MPADAFDRHARDGYGYWFGWLRAIAQQALTYLDDGRPQAAREELRRGLEEANKAKQEIEGS